MRVWSVHCVFAIILVGSLVINMRASSTLIESDNIEPAVIRVAQSHGLARYEDAAIADENFRALRFEVPGCARPILVVLLSVTFEQEPLARSLRRQGDALRYIYVDRTWDAPNRLAVFFEWKKYKLLAGFGLTQYAPSRYMLLLHSPAGCREAETIDWKDVWRREYPTAAGANSDAITD